MHRTPLRIQNKFERAMPKGCRVESYCALPVPGWECDDYVCRITDGSEVFFLATNHASVVKISKKEIKDRLQVCNTLYKDGTSWLETQ